MLGIILFMSEPQILNKVTDELKEKLYKCFSIGVFAGAGISAASKIATFRGANSSYYFKSHNPVYLCSMDGLRQFPDIAWSYYLDLYKKASEAKPNIAHQCIATWQKEAARRRIVKFYLLTSNFDGLLSKAGATATELHNNIFEAICQKCEKKKPMSEIAAENLPPKCECGEMLLPSFTLLDGYINQNAYDEGITVSRSCWVYFVIGTSGVHNHSINFVQMLKMRGNITFIEVNPRPSHLSQYMHYILRGKAEDILPQFEYGTVNI